MISRDGNPTSLGQAIAHYGRIFKTLHILRLADDEPYRREAKAQSNLQEGRHDLGRAIFHGRKGEITRGYLDGMENQLSALGLILNIVVLWNSVYSDRALAALREQDYPLPAGTTTGRCRSATPPRPPSRPSPHPGAPVRGVQVRNVEFQ
ncbi:Tn3 family transposase [Nocardia sp. NBC_00416]|uniref:Tn3 family transposase n=1 Tax=Nocardia sp. NBC_00416 TaxID=2975991 RepID=UPI003FA53AD6